jgi:hypothetical protein
VKDIKGEGVSPIENTFAISVNWERRIMQQIIS